MKHFLSFCSRAVRAHRPVISCSITMLMYILIVRMDEQGTFMKQAIYKIYLSSNTIIDIKPHTPAPVSNSKAVHIHTCRPTSTSPVLA